MIDPKKWENSSDEIKLMACRIIKAVFDEDKVTKADTKLITDFLVNKCEEK